MAHLKNTSVSAVPRKSTDNELLYATWRNMQSRCYNPRNKMYADYGGRGVTVAARWRGRQGFANFKQDMGPKPTPQHTIERIKNARGYSPGNCRWGTRTDQARNRRSNVTVEYEGVTCILIELAERKNFPYKLLWRRVVAHGWSIERALTTPQDAATAQSRHVYTYAGETKTLRDWAASLSIPYQTLYERVVRRGIPFGDSLQNRRRRT